MLVKKSAISNETQTIIKKSIDSFIGKPKQGTGMEEVISEILLDKDLFLYMATHSIKDSGIILGRMRYFDDISVEVPYGIAYNFEKPSLNIFLFDFIPASPAEKPIKTLQLTKMLPSKKSMGINAEQNYSNYPTVDSFVNSLNNILQKEIKEQKGYWVNFNKPFYP